MMISVALMSLTESLAVKAIVNANLVNVKVIILPPPHPWPLVVEQFTHLSKEVHHMIGRAFISLNFCSS